MQLPTMLRGREFGPEQLAQVQALLGQNDGWSHYRLSRELARLWDLRTRKGQPKDMAARTLFVKMQEQGWIKLPAPRMTRSGRPPVSRGAGPGGKSGGLRLGRSGSAAVAREVSQAGHGQARRQLEAALHRYHYLG